MRPNQKLEYIGDIISKYVIALALIEKHSQQEIEKVLTNKNMGRVYKDFLNGELPVPLHGREVDENGIISYSMYYAREFECAVGRMFYKEGFEKAKQFIEETLLKDFNDKK